MLVENAQEQEAMELMKLLRNEGKSYQQIAAVLDEQRGIAPKCGGRWFRSTVNKELRRAT